MQRSSSDGAGFGVRITGTPRTGKTVFLRYVAERLKASGIPFVIMHGTLSFNSNYERCDLSDLDGTLRDPSCYYLIDPDDSTDTVLKLHSAFPVFFSSPTVSNYTPNNNVLYTNSFSITMIVVLKDNAEN